ncbi:bifunctional cytidylyltransferase/SDR family oxidoreductase [Agromyces atrinae]|uniref:bifunctional cytidylyltransferase/SDR family oxidoreductase n=1 Tax=Agromyces atrinae TaxID=592376 RepID=UPI001F5AEAF9|nr:bifunctional cytidylyltransferase/SDR family oxidoreductase [Agromyces atrinae]MCI2958028.1 bifunctional cytidylyltransferase/SDR family oxidoreductase [Agromyces atrinae]
MSSGRQRNIAVVLAGGVGTRVGLGIPKQLIRIAGKAIVEHTIEVLSAHERIDEVIVMMNAETIHELDYLKLDPRFEKLTAILPGGATRNDTTELALAALPTEGDESITVLLHDAVRPFIDERIISDCIDALDSYDAVDTAIPSADTIIEVDSDRLITGIPPRAALRRGQTPQAFRLPVIRRAYALARQDPQFSATDDCGVVFTYLPDVPIYVVDGTPENMKITEPLDIHIADKLFQLQSAELAGTDATPLPDLTGSNIVVFGGSSGIGASVAELARSAGATVHAFSRSATGTDVTKRKAIRAALELAERDGPIDHIVVTAGLLSRSPLADADPAELRKMLEVNLMAPVKISQEAYPALHRSGGNLVFFTSSSYTRGRASYSMYSATKAAVVNLTQALADEWGDDGIRVNCINPERTETPMRQKAFGDEPSDTLLAASSVARATLRVLDSPVTGQVIDVRRDHRAG